MDKRNIMEYYMLPGCVFLIGVIMFVWFCWPAFFKGMINIGNSFGMLISALMIFCGIRYETLRRIFDQLWQKKPMRSFILLAVMLITAAVILMIAASAAILGAASKNIPQNTPAIVLGCAVKGSRPSKVLRERIDAAYDYMQEHPQAVCILSGGKGKGEDISEAECMYCELIRAGIDASRLYREEESVNTEQNLKNSINILGEYQSVEAVTVISSEFHLYRGKWWAMKSGYQSYGYASRTDWKYLPTLFLREVIAVVHLWLTA